MLNCLYSSILYSSFSYPANIRQLSETTKLFLLNFAETCRFFQKAKSEEENIINCRNYASGNLPSPKNQEMPEANGSVPEESGNAGSSCLPSPKGANVNNRWWNDRREWNLRIASNSLLPSPKGANRSKTGCDSPPLGTLSATCWLSAGSIPFGHFTSGY